MSTAVPSESAPAPDAYQRYIIPDPLGRTVLRKCCGLGAILVALPLTIVCSAALDAVFLTRGEPIGWGWWFTALAVAVVSGALFPLLLRMALGLLSRSGARVLTNDSRPPFLYLRSFQDDARIIDRGDRWRLVFFASRYETPERSLAKAVDDVGTLVAIGKPGETLRPCGAARMYVDGDHWQNVVSQLVADARLVILRIGRTRGFWWEVQHVLERCDPRKILFYLPKGDRGAHYQYLREQAAGVLPCPLPEHPGHASFLAFGPGWEPRLHGAERTSWFSRMRRLATGSPAPILREALNPTLAETGVKLQRMPLRLHEYFALTALSFTVVGAIAIVPIFLVTVRMVYFFRRVAIEDALKTPVHLNEPRETPTASELLRELDLPPDDLRLRDDLDPSLIEPEIFKRAAEDSTGVLAPGNPQNEALIQTLVPELPQDLNVPELIPGRGSESGPGGRLGDRPKRE